MEHYLLQYEQFPLTKSFKPLTISVKFVRQYEWTLERVVVSGTEKTANDWNPLVHSSLRCRYQKRLARDFDLGAKTTLSYSASQFRCNRYALLMRPNETTNNMSMDLSNGLSVNIAWSSITLLLASHFSWNSVDVNNKAHNMHFNGAIR